MIKPFNIFSVSGCTDYFATDETQGFKMCREIVESLNMRPVPVPNTSSFLQPKADLTWTGNPTLPTQKVEFCYLRALLNQFTSLFCPLFTPTAIFTVNFTDDSSQKAGLEYFT